MDGENNGKPYEQMDDFGGFSHYFWKHPYIPGIFWKRLMSQELDPKQLKRCDCRESEFDGC